MKVKKCLAFLMSVVMLFGMMPLTVFATEAPAWIADYTVEASCGTENTTLGIFNGSSACINANTGDLHYCNANFPYLEMQCAVYTAFCNELSTIDKVNASINTQVFMDLEKALQTVSLDVHAHTRSKNETPTVQGVQYFTGLTYFLFDGSGMYDGRYDGNDTIQSIDLSKNTQLKELHLYYFSMEGIDLSANSALKRIEFRHSADSASSRETKYNGLERLKSLDLSALTNLERLDMYDQDIEVLDLSKNTNLSDLTLHLFTKLHTLDLSENEALTDLCIFKSGLTELDLHDKPVLTQAEIYTNANLQSIDISGCTVLDKLNLNENALESIDLTNNTELTTLQIDANKLKSLDLSQNTKLYSLSCKNNQLTSLDLSNNTAVSSCYLTNQIYEIATITDDSFDLHDLPAGFDISQVQVNSDGNGGTYQFNVKSSDSFGAASNYQTVGEDLLLKIEDDNCLVYYSYFAGKKANGTDIYMSVQLKVKNKYYTLSSGTPGVALKAFSYSSGVGADLDGTTVRRGNSVQFVVELDESSSLHGKVLAVFSQAEGEEKKAVSAYTYNDTVYYSVSSIYGPTVITVEEGHLCVFGDWTPVENTTKHERRCTVDGCTEVETGWCSDYFGEEYHVNLTTMQQNCTLCGRQHTWEIDASGSCYVPAKEATCATPGNKEFWICGHCDKYFADENCQNEVTPIEVYINPLEHNYVDGTCSQCGYVIKQARFVQCPVDTFSSDDCYLYVLIGVGSDGKLYAMGEATGDGRRYGVEIPGAQIDENGVITLTPEQAEFMDFEYYFENGSGASTTSTFLVDGNFMTARYGKIYTFPQDRLDDKGNPRPFAFRQANYGDESGLGYIYCDLYDPDTDNHTMEYITFNPETLCFEACSEQRNTIYLYRQVCDHEEKYLSHTYPVAPTCTQQGFGGDYWYCAMCNKFFTDETCTTEYEFPEGVTDEIEYFNIPALGHTFADNGVCENCGMKRPVYTPVTSLAQFDQISENAYYIIVFKDGDKTYAAWIPNVNAFEKMINDDSDSDGIIDLLESDTNGNGIPDLIENSIDTQWGGADCDGDGITTVEEYNAQIGDMTDDEIVNMDDYLHFFEYNVSGYMWDQFEMENAEHSNVVEVTVAADGSITIEDEGAMEFQMIKAGVWGGQPALGEDLEYDYEYFGILDTERIRAIWIPNYWIANDGHMGYYGNQFMIQYRWFGDHVVPGIIDNKNWKIGFKEDGTVLLVSTWTDFEDSAALQLVRYTDENGIERVTMVGCYGEFWQYSEILSNCTVISGAYLYVSEPVYIDPPHDCVWGPWQDDDVTDTHTRTCTVDGCDKKQTEEHHWDNGVQTEAPTCTEEGTILYTCPDCGATRTDTIPALDHDWGEWVYDSVDSHIRYCKRENCDAEDYGGHEWGEWKPADGNTHKMICDICKGEQIEEHDWNNGVVTKEPTEWEEGVMTYTCTTCDHTKTEPIEKLVHECIWTDWYPNGDENHKRDCMDDNCDKYETLPHDWDSGVITKEPTCQEKGVKTYTCQVCQHIRTEEIPVVAHQYGDWTPNEDGKTHSRSCRCNQLETAEHTFDEGVITDRPSHTTKGVKTYTCTGCGYAYAEEIPMLTDHEWGEWVVNKLDEANTHIRYCVCGETQTAPHNFDNGKISQEATHTANGIKVFTCGDCGHTYTEEIPALTDHTWGRWQADPTVSGKHYRECACGAREIGDCAWDTGILTREATCIEDGEMIHTCEICRATKAVVIAALGHKEVEDAAVAPTCTTTGKTAGKHCSVCNTVLVAQTEVAALEHDEVKHEAKAPTCTEYGWDAYVTCSRCDYSTYKQIDATGHNYTYKVTEPTCTEAGYTTHTCENCGASYMDNHVEALGHDYATVEVIDPTCTEDGYTLHTCHCGDSYKDSFVDNLGGHIDEDDNILCDRCKALLGELQQEIDTNVTNKDLSEELKDTDFNTAEKVKTELEKQMHAELEKQSENADVKVEFATVVDVVLTYKNSKGKTQEATTDHFPENGKVTIYLPIPEGTDPMTHKYHVAHMYGTDAFGKKAGDVEVITNLHAQPDGKGGYVIVVELTGLSPIMICAEEHILGDANCDGKINTRDAKLIMQYELGIVDETALAIGAADVNGDGAINTRDAKMIMQYELGLIDHFPESKLTAALECKMLLFTASYHATVVSMNNL